jgi:hypothetical protein
MTLEPPPPTRYTLVAQSFADATPLPAAANTAARTVVAAIASRTGLILRMQNPYQARCLPQATAIVPLVTN